jgi:hypothetical protein
MLLLLCLLSFSHALVELPMRARGGELHKRLTQRALDVNAALGIVTNSTPSFFDQLVWHNDSSKGTFKQRYYYDTSAWSGKNDAPVWLYIGERVSSAPKANPWDLIPFPSFLCRRRRPFRWDCGWISRISG